MEIWKTIEGYEDYQVSSYGRVKSLKKGNEFFLKGLLTKNNYITVGLRAFKKTKTFYIHRLVATYHIKTKSLKLDVNHINGIKIDNSIKNLEWVNRRENCCHRFKSVKKASKHIGVSYQKSINKWRASIQFKGKAKTLGVFKTEIEAYHCRVNFEKENNIINKYL